MIYDWYCPRCDSDVRTEVKKLKYNKKINCPRCNMRYTVKANKDKVARLDIVNKSKFEPKGARHCAWCQYFDYFDTVQPITELNAMQEVGRCVLESCVENYYYRKICNKAEAYEWDDHASSIIKDAFSYSYTLRILCENFNQVNDVVMKITDMFRDYKITYSFASCVTDHTPTDLERYPLRITVIKESLKASILMEYGVFELDDNTVYYYNFFHHFDIFTGESITFI